MGTQGTQKRRQIDKCCLALREAKRAAELTVGGKHYPYPSVMS